MSLHKEITFEAEICQHLAANGWLYAEGDTANYDRALALYPADVIKGKLLESETLRQQAANNSKEQFANSPDLHQELMNAIMDSSTAMSSLSKQALESEHVRSGLKDVLLGPARLYEALRAFSDVGHSGD